MRKLQSQGVHHITLVGADRQTSIDFWEGVLGMPFVFEQPNLDNPGESHLYFDPGDGRLITIFTNEERVPDPARTPTDPGCVHHLALSVSKATFDQAIERLDDRVGDDLRLRRLVEDQAGQVGHPKGGLQGEPGPRRVAEQVDGSVDRPRHRRHVPILHIEGVPGAKRAAEPTPPSVHGDHPEPVGQQGYHPGPLPRVGRGPVHQDQCVTCARGRRPEQGSVLRCRP